MVQPGLYWYKLGTMIEDIGIIGPTKVLDFTDTIPEHYYAAPVEIDSVEWFYILTDEVLTYPALTDEEVIAQDIDPDRTLSGGP